MKKKEQRTANKVLPKAGQNGFEWTFVQGSTAVILLSFSAKIPRLRQYAKRRTNGQLLPSLKLARETDFLQIRRVKKQKEIGLEFEVDKLTNSIENVKSGDSFPTEISLLTKVEARA